MKNKKLISEDIESIIYMMNYDTRKTLTENREILNEQQQYPPFPIKLNPTKVDDSIATEIAMSVNMIGTNLPNLIAGIKKIKDVQTFYNVQSLIKKSTSSEDSYKDFTALINGELERDNSVEVKTISNYFNSIPGIFSSFKYNSDYDRSFDVGSFTVYGQPSDPRLKPVKTDTAVKTDPTVKTDPAAKTPDKSIGAGGEPKTKKAVTPLPIPPQLKDSAGVKKFQEWVINTMGNKTILGSYGADGKFGGRTSKAWANYGNRYLNPYDTSKIAAPAVQTYKTADQTKNTPAQETLPMGVSGPANQVAQPTTTTTETLPTGVSGPANQVTKQNNTFDTTSTTNPNKDKELKLS